MFHKDLLTIVNQGSTKDFHSLRRVTGRSLIDMNIVTSWFIHNVTGNETQSDLTSHLHLVNVFRISVVAYH